MLELRKEFKTEFSEVKALEESAFVWKSLNYKEQVNSKPFALFHTEKND